MSPPDVSRGQRFVASQRDVRQHSAELKKELSLTNLVLSQVLYIMGLTWLGAAAKLGSSHAFFWVLAALLLYLPSALVVIHLTREMPLEGGLYQWAKLRWGDMTGFLVAWNLWLYSVLLISELGLVTANNLAYAAGPSGAWFAESKWAILGTSVVLSVGLMLVAIRGLALGKWIHNIAGVTLLVLFAMMTFFAAPRWSHGTASVAPVSMAAPALSLLHLNILGKMGFGAFSGSEGASVFAGEIKDPDAARVIRLSVWLAAPVVTILFILGTACVLAYARPDDVDLVSPVAQNLSLGARSYGFAVVAVPVAMALMLVARIGTGSFIFNLASRLPMLAGWDHLLPPWFTRLHPRYRTPVGSVVFVGIMVLLFAIGANVGVGSQEAFQLLNNGSGICYALGYLVMFAIPLAARGGRGTEKAPPLVRVAAVFGFLLTLLYVVLSVFPIVDVKDGSHFTAKVSAVVVASNLLGVAFFLRARARRRCPPHRREAT